MPRDAHRIGVLASAEIDRTREQLARVESLFLEPLSGQGLGAEALRDGLFAVRPQSGVIRRAPDRELLSSIVKMGLPDRAVSLQDYRDFVTGVVVPGAVNIASPRCFGHMSSVAPAFLKELQVLIAGMNQNLVKFEASRSLTHLERQTLAMLHHLVFARDEVFYRRHGQSPQSVLGIVASGATLANLTGLWIARNRRLSVDLNGNGIEQEGVSQALRRAGYVDAVIVGSRLMHYSIQKAAGILGLGERSVLTAPTDADGRVDVAACRDMIRQCEQAGRCVLALVGVAGTTDCGSVDPLAELAELAWEHRTHFHVDAAWGAPLLFSPAYRGLLAGIEKADTVTIDGHKQFYVPIGVGVLLLRDSMAARVIEKRSHYMLQHGTSDLGHQSAEGSRPATALLLHAALSVIGREGFELLMEENIRKARHLARRISESEDFELLMSPATNIVLYRYLPAALRNCKGLREQTPQQREAIDSFNERLQRAQFEDGRSLVSRTRLERGTAGSVTALRAVIANPLSRDDDLDHLLDDQRRIAEQISPRVRRARAARRAGRA